MVPEHSATLTAVINTQSIYRRRVLLIIVGLSLINHSFTGGVLIEPLADDIQALLAQRPASLFSKVFVYIRFVESSC
jgi:hypothetical protein